jgi:hypothetical protein
MRQIQFDTLVRVATYALEVNLVPLQVMSQCLYSLETNHGSYYLYFMAMFILFSCIAMNTDANEISYVLLRIARGTQ